MRAALAKLGRDLYASPVLLLILTTLFWGGNAVAARFAVGHISPLTLVSVRWLLVVAILWPIFGDEVRRQWPELRRRLPWLVGMTLIGFTVFNVLFYVAAKSTTAINLGIIQGSMPVFVLLGAFLAYRTPVTAIQIVGVLLTLIGVAVVATRGSLAAIATLDVTIGDIEILIACLFYAAYTVGLRRRPAMDGAAFFTVLAVIAAITSVPLIAVDAVVNGLVWPTPQGWLIALFVAIFPSTLSQLFFMRGVDLIGPGPAGVYINLVPVFAALLAVLLLGEPFALHHAVSLALVLGGIWLAQR